MDTNDDPLSAVFSALADPTRRSIVSRLASQTLTVNEIAMPYDISLPAISKHLRILEKAGLVSQMRDAQYRPRYLTPTPMEMAARWLHNYQHNEPATKDTLL